MPQCTEPASFERGEMAGGCTFQLSGTVYNGSRVRHAILPQSPTDAEFLSEHLYCEVWL
jgi:hypothetical protein